MNRVEPFEASWHRIDRAKAHRDAAAGVWNDFVDRDPYGVFLDDEGEGQFVIRVVQQEPPPTELAVLTGEWLYNLRCALDYAIYDVAVCATGRNPPPGRGTLQFPIYDTEQGWNRNRHRLGPLAEHHIGILEIMQPYRHEDPDTSALGWVNRLARIDRHRHLTVMAAYMSEMRPIVGVPEGCAVDMTFGERVIINDEAQIARFTVRPWREGWEVEANPQTGLDPEIAEWAESPFWRRIDYNQRLRMVQLVVETTLVTLEYDCVGHSREAQYLTDDFRVEADARREEWRNTGPLGER